MLRSRSALSCAILLSTVLAGCSDNGREPKLSQVEPITVPVADTTTRVNVNTTSPTLQIATAFPIGDGDELTLVFSDEFDGAQLDPEVWLFEEGDGSQYGIPGWGNNELQYYLPDNARLEDGKLKITAKRETVGSFGFTSARITTQDRFAVTYGRIEASIKLPAGQGLWPAFWMLPQDDEAGSPPAVGVYGGFSASGEIDIMEAVNLGGRPGPGGIGGGNEIFGTIHFGGEFPANQFTTVEYEPAESLTNQFNTFAVEWDEFEIRWYVNGFLFSVQNSWSSAAAPYPAPFDQPFEILLNLAVGGNFPGSPDSSTPFPAVMEVDWVRVYSGEGPSGGMPSEPMTPAPTPTEDAADVVSLFSDSYTDITGINYNPNSGQATVFSQAQIAGNQMLRYAGLDFQVIDFASNPQDVTDQGYLHVDVWTADSTELNVALASSSSIGGSTAIAVAANSWVSVDIPLTEFAGVDLADVVQVVFDGNGTIFVDNLYFAGDAPLPATAGEVPDVKIVAADGSMPDLAPTFDPFGSGTTFVTNFAGDFSFANAVEVTVGGGYGGGALAQLGLTGLTPGFASSYSEFVFKVKGLDADNTIQAKLEEPFPGTSVPVQIDLASPPANVTVTDLGDGWSQVVIDMAAYGDVSTFSQIVFQTLDGAYAVGDDLYLTDIGFNNALATAGEVPGVGIITADGSMPDLVAGTDFTGFEAFGTGGSNDTAFTGDSSYANVVAVTPGAGYGGGSLGQFGIVGFTPGFASAYETLLFKLKGLTDNTVVVKLEEPFPGASVPVTVDLASPPAGVTVTDLGDGWSQVEIPIANFGDVSTFSQIVIESVPGSQAQGDAFFVTDIGFTSAGAGAGEVPDESIITADGSAPDLVAGTDFTGFEAFGTGGSNDYAFSGDSSYANVVAVTPGAGYGGGPLGQFGTVGFTPGFASAYDALLFKVKGLSDGTAVVKLEEPFPGASTAVTVDLASPPAGVAVTDLGDGWSQVVIPIANFGNVSTFSQIVIESVPGSQAEGDAFFVTDLGFTSAGGGGGGGTGTELAVNGGFETGDYSDWQQAINSGVQTISSDTPTDGGSFSASLSVTGAGTTEIKQANLGAGTVAVGDVVTITFDIKGTFGPGGQVNVLSFTEFAGGGADQSNNTIIAGGVENWTTQTYDVTLSGGDAGGGFSLAFNPVCGAVAGCFADVLIDNVSIVLNGTGGGGAGAGAGEVPDESIITADGSAPDLVAGTDFTGFEAFGTGGSNDYAFSGDSSYANVVAVTPGAGYGGGPLGQFGTVGFTPGFASAYDALLFKVKGLSDGTAVVKLEEPFPGASTAVTVDLASPPAGVTVTDLGDGWSQVVIPIANFGNVSTFSQIVIESVPGSQAEGDAFFVTDLGFTSAGGGGGGGTGTELAVNGGFETGDYSDWQQAINSGVQTISSDTPTDGGSFSASLSVTGAGTTEIKQANLGAGTVAVGDVVTITFDIKGTFGPGGQVNVLSFTEFAGGGADQSNNTIIAGGVENWTTQTYDVTLSGGDAGGGFSLAFNPVCGAVAGCFADVLIDNVSIVLN